MRAPSYRAGVLSVATVGQHGWTYYLQTVAAEQRKPGGLVEPDGVWLGSGSLGLRLDGGAVDRARLASLLAGADPVSGEVLDPRHGRVRVLAYDCTFAAPKSVSVVHALAGPDVVEEIRRAHEASVEAALGFLEGEAGRVRDRRGGGDRLEQTRGLTAAAFLHRTSRAPDPHLHSHVLVANLASGPDGRWSAIDSRPLHLYASAAGALYRSQLRAELVRRLDVEWCRRPDGFADLAGVSAEVVTTFSRRRTAILEELERSGRSGSNAARAAAAATRPGKDLGTPYEALVAGWRERAYDIGISAGHLRSVASRRESPLGRDERVTDRRPAAPELESRPFTVREMVRSRADAQADGRDVLDVVAAVDAEVEVGLASGALLVDPDPRRWAPSLRGRGGRIPAGVLDTRLVTREYRALEQGLASELAAAPLFDGDGRRPGLYVLPGGPDPFDAPESLSIAVASASAEGREIVAVAPGSRRAAHLEALTGVEVRTRASLPARTEEALVVVADAGCWDLPVLADAIRTARAGAATVVVLGSTRLAGRTAIAESLLRRGPVRSGVGTERATSDAGRRASRPSGVRADLAMTRPAPDRRRGAEAVQPVLVDRPGNLLAALLHESAEQRAARGRSIVVVADVGVAEALAAATVAAGGEATEWTTASSLPKLLGVREPGERPVGLVVLGGARLLARSVLARPEVARVHVSVGPPGAGEAARRAFEERLVSTRPVERSGRVREVPATARSVGGGRQGGPREPERRGAGIGR